MNQEATDKIKELEIFDLGKDNLAFHKESTNKLDDPYIRLAAVIFHILSALIFYSCLCQNLLGRSKCGLSCDIDIDN